MITSTRIQTWFVGFIFGVIASFCILSTANAEEPNAYALILHIKQNDLNVSTEQLRSALYNELKIPIVLGEPSAASNALVIEAQGVHHSRIAFQKSNGQVIERTLDLSLQSPQAIETIALLAGNLVRNEAAELLARLHALEGGKQTIKGIKRTTVARKPTPFLYTQQKPASEEFHCTDFRISQTTFNVDLIPFVGTSSFRGTQSLRTVSLNLLAGYGASIVGVEVGGVFNMESRSMCGAQIAGLLNVVDGPVYGLQLASMINTANKPLIGVQLSGLSNSSGGASGVQLSIVSNMAYGQVYGVQASAGYNFAKYVTGVQVGAINVDTGALSGAQIGFVNVQLDSIREGVQFGGVNIVTNRTQGAQIGALNISTKKVEGLQLGLLNIAEDSTASVGLLNLLWRGNTHIDVWTHADRFSISAGVKHGGSFVHNIYGIGAQNFGEPKIQVAGILGIGGHYPVNDKTYIDLDLIGYSSFLSLFGATKFSILNELRILLNYKFFDAISFYVGPTFNLFINSNKEIKDPSWLGSFRSEKAQTMLRMWPGFTLGMRFL